MKFENILQNIGTHKVASIDGTPEEIADALNQIRAAACKRSISVDTTGKPAGFIVGPASPNRDT